MWRANPFGKGRFMEASTCLGTRIGAMNLRGVKRAEARAPAPARGVHAASMSAGVRRPEGSHRSWNASIAQARGTHGDHEPPMGCRGFLILHFAFCTLHCDNELHQNRPCAVHGEPPPAPHAHGDHEPELSLIRPHPGPTGVELGLKRLEIRQMLTLALTLDLALPQRLRARVRAGAREPVVP